MKKFSSAIFFMTMALYCSVAGASTHDGFDRVRFKIPIQVQGQSLHSAEMLIKFYEHRDNILAWSEKKQLRPAVNDLIVALKQCDRDGLKPEDYHLNMIQSILNTVEKEGSHLPLADYADLDFLLTDAFLTYGAHLLSGSVNPKSVDDEWFAKRRTGDLHEMLEQAVESNQIREQLENLLPKHPVYQRMREALARYRTIEKMGGWNILPFGPAIKRGDKDVRIPVLKARLHHEGYFKAQPDEGLFFNSAVERALKQFQQDHGLDADGVLGETTLRELNVPVELRVRQLRVNMERMRWLPADLGEKHVFVNIPDFYLHVVENDEPVIEMKVIVGRKMRRTPVFSSAINRVVLNPSWTVTKNVATTDILDHLHEDPDYLQKNGFLVYSDYSEKATLIDPNTVNWSSMTSQNLPFKFKQRPGYLNALGQIKFLFPNDFDIYLHDTVSRNLFKKRIRDFSSGCIRVEQPLDLAEFVLSGDPVWTRENLSKALKSGGNEQYISLKETVPVHLMYWTAWVDQRGRVQFRDDLYGRDELLNQALHSG